MFMASSLFADEGGMEKDVRIWYYLKRKICMKKEGAVVGCGKQSLSRGQ